MSEPEAGVVAAISAQLPDIDSATVSMVLTAWNTVKNGDPLGTVLMSSEGAVAVRISDAGAHMWRVTAADGSTWTETQPTLAGWTVIKEGEPSA